MTVTGHRATISPFPAAVHAPPRAASRFLLLRGGEGSSSDGVVQEPFATAPTSPAAPAAVSTPALTPAERSVSFYDVNAGEHPNREDEAPEEVEAADANGAPAVEKHNKLSVAETPGSETLPQPTAVAPNGVDTAKTDECTPPPPPPPAAVHDSEGSSDTQSADDHGSPQRETPRTPSTAGGAKAKRDVAPSRSSRLLAFRSFSRDKKAKAPVGAASPAAEGRVPSAPGEHPPPAHGKARDEGDEHKEKGKERRKRFWK